MTFCELPLWEICIPRIVQAEEILIGCFVECQSIKKVGGRRSVEELYQALFFVSPVPPECFTEQTKIEPDRRLQISLSLNLLEKLETARKCLTSWSLRRLSLIGKIVVLKSLLVSQLVYVLTSLQSKESIIRKVNSLFYVFCGTKKAIK